MKEKSNMKHAFCALVTALLAFCLCLSFAGCSSTGGTYYLVENDKYDTETYFVLKGGTWTDDDGASGDYEIDGEKITLYTDMFGERVESSKGTVKDGVLTIFTIAGDVVYCKEGSEPSGGGADNNQEETPKPDENAD